MSSPSNLGSDAGRRQVTSGTRIPRSPSIELEATVDKKVTTRRKTYFSNNVPRSRTAASGSRKEPQRSRPEPVSVFTRVPTPTSSPSSVSDNDVRTNLREFFDFCPSALEKGEGHTTSYGTREPSDFDVHLSEDLILKKVVHLPTMLKSLVELADNVADQSDLPDWTKPFPAEELLGAARKVCIVLDEKGVESAYASFAKIVLAIAATLEFGCKDWDGSFVGWDLSPNARAGGKAAADGFLNVYKKAKTPFPAGMKDVYEFLRCAGIWEFKNLNAGDLVHMEAIHRLCDGELFPWRTCSYGANCSIYHKDIRTGGHRVTGARCGFDSDSSHLQLADARDISCVRYQKESSRNSQNHAHCMLQQIWAEAVQTDSSFVSLHSGAFEIIGFRHRGSQTLYISDIVSVPEFSYGYGRLQTGLMLGMIRDAKRRAYQLKHARILPRLWNQGYHNTSTDAPISITFPRQKEKLSIIRPVETFESQRALLFEAFSIPRLVVRSDLEPESSTSMMPLKDRPYIRLAVTSVFTGIESRADLYLEITIPTNAWCIDLGKVFLGEKLTIGHRLFKGNSLCMKRFAIKVATSPEEILLLKNEHSVYCKLIRKGVQGIATPIGLFSIGMGQNQRLLLLVEYAGEKANIQKLSQPVKDRFLSCIDAIHDAGILHGGLSEDSLLLRNDCDPYIVGFSQSQPISGKRCTDAIEERELLQLILRRDEPELKRVKSHGVYIAPVRWEQTEIVSSFVDLIAPLPAEEKPVGVVVDRNSAIAVDIDFGNDRQAMLDFATSLEESGILKDRKLVHSIHPPATEHELSRNSSKRKLED